MVLAADIVTDVHAPFPLVREGVVLDYEYREALLRAGIHAIYVRDELSEGIKVSRVLSEESRQAATQALATAFERVPALLETGRPLSGAAVGDLNEAVGLICADLADADDAVMALTDLAAADLYTLQHSIDVTALGLLIARRHFREFGRPAAGGVRRTDDIEGYLRKLGLGLLLHDIGKLAIPTPILNKPDRLDDEEMELMQMHPLLGLELLPGDRVGPLAKSVIRSHHERWNGSGYPHGLHGLEIPEFARIAGIADSFDAITSARPYATPAPTHVGVQAILDGRGTLYDPDLVDTFRQVVAPYPPGSEIELADGRRGIVVSVPARDLAHPLVRAAYGADGQRIELEEIDLSEQPELAPQSLLRDVA
jgi:HD-GYP domain-containing protein (c-di-GMP phosphodiesterase class II)